LTTIKDILRGLSPPQREQIMYAFENSEPTYIEYQTGKYVAVNVNENVNLKEEDRVGTWSSGLILKGR
jgi:hypothetical protein